MTAAPQEDWRGPAPGIGSTVHAVSRGEADGAYPKVCRAAIVTEISSFSPFVISVCVLSPSGVHHDSCLYHGPGDPGGDAPGARCASGDRAYPGGTWHWPEQVPARPRTGGPPPPPDEQPGGAA